MSELLVQDSNSIPLRAPVESIGNPWITFIIPVLNDDKNIARCLRSILSFGLEEKEFEVLIFDNGSTDHTQQILQEMGFSFMVITKVNVSVLRNHGAALARGDYLAFVDSDVELSPQWVKECLMAFKDPRVIASGCFPEVPPGPTWVQETWDIHQRGGRSVGALSPVSWLPSMNLLVRRDAFSEVGGFNEQLETAEDVDLCYRLGQHGTILNNPGMEAIHWGEARNLSAFWRKEVWRGIGNLRGVFSHGFRWDELPSLGYPVWVISFLSILGIGTLVDLWRGQFFFSLLSLVFLLLPPFSGEEILDTL